MSDNKDSLLRGVKKTVKTFTFGAVLGVVAGGVIGLLKAQKPGKELEKDIKNKWAELSIRFDDLRKDYEPKLDRIFGKIGSDTQKIYSEIKEDIVIAAKEVRGDIDEKKYKKIVDKVISSHKKKKKYLSEKLDELGNEFKESWEEIKNVFS